MTQAKSKVVSALLIVIVLTVLGVLAWSAFAPLFTPSVCDICQRPLQQSDRVRVEIGGHEKVVCCPRCAISAAFQEQQPVHLIEVTDHATRKSLEPQKAIYVDGAHLMQRSHDNARVDADKHAVYRTFDRWYPEVYAFARREDAEAFQRDNGGAVLTFGELMRNVPHR